MEIVQWIIAGLCGLVFTFYAIVNAWCLISRLWLPCKEHIPAAYITGGLCGFMALLLVPIGTVSERMHYAWVPMVLDIGCLLFLVVFAMGIAIEIMEARRTKVGQAQDSVV